jgi:predicted aminopeptidase
MKPLHGALIIGAAALIAGCANLAYYAQAAHGQFSLLSAARPIQLWLADPATEPRLKDKLTKAQAMRRFAVGELALPDNASYTSYADVKRPFVLWNVVAAPALSLEPKRWCFPVAGCVSYRGYYSKEEAQAYAAELRAEGNDVQVAGVPAYSTLGWFNDPLISTFINYPDGQLARLVFHELAHQVVYAAGDSEFNESFATAVEEAGVQRWLSMQGDDAMRRNYAAYETRKSDFLALLLKHRNALQMNYASGASDADKYRQKAHIFQSLQAEYQVLKTTWGGYAGYDRWFAEPLSNAHLAAVATYQNWVPGFRALLAHEHSFNRFYVAVAALAKLEKSERQRKLRGFAQNQFS